MQDGLDHVYGRWVLGCIKRASETAASPLVGPLAFRLIYTRAIIAAMGIGMTGLIFGEGIAKPFNLCQHLD